MAKIASLEERITQHAYHLGFDAIGFCEASLTRDVKARMQDFVAKQYHGSMDWLAQRLEQRVDPRALWPEVKSVISLGVSYAPDFEPLVTLRQKNCGNISVYARNRDYHDVIKGMLKHLAQFIHKLSPQAEIKVFVDTAPVAEKSLAEKAHLGWQGKHTNLVSRQHGSWLFLGEIFTSLRLETSAPQPGRCGSCQRCLDACPTNAFEAPYKLDARKCISYLTIEHKGPIAPELCAKMGNHIYGCDDCLAVCPWNRFARAGRQMKLIARDDLSAPLLTELAALTESSFRSRFTGSPIKRIGRTRFVRNVLIAMGNAQDPSYDAILSQLCNDADPVIAPTARWARINLSCAI